MNNIGILLEHMRATRHPGADVIERAIEVSNCPQFLAGVGRALVAAAEADIQAESDRLDTLLAVLRRETEPAA